MFRYCHAFHHSKGSRSSRSRSFSHWELGGTKTQSFGATQIQAVYAWQVHVHGSNAKYEYSPILQDCLRWIRGKDRRSLLWFAPIFLHIDVREHYLYAKHSIRFPQQELAPVIYTPTVGHACVEWSNIYPFLAPPGTPDGLYLTQADLPNIKEVIRNYRPFPADPNPFSPEIAVISDGSRILGLGDLGVNGMGIPIGKLQLYVAGAGIDPRRTMPIMLDLGTNNDKYLNDEFYLGVRSKRPDDNMFYDAVDQVLSALYSEFPELLVQFEDWSSEHAFGLLEKYQHKTFCFNDDIQGTGAVILSGLMNAYKIVAREDNVQAKDQRIVFFGAGSAGIGVAKQIKDYFLIEHGFTEEEARKVFYIVDSKGLITNDRGDRLAEHKKYFSRDDNNGQQFKDLLDIINYVKPTT